MCNHLGMTSLRSIKLSLYYNAGVFLYAVGRKNLSDGYKFGGLSRIALVTPCLQFSSRPPAKHPEAKPSGCLDWRLTLPPSLPVGHCQPMVHGFSCRREIVPRVFKLVWWVFYVLPTSPSFSWLVQLLRGLGSASLEVSVGSTWRVRIVLVQEISPQLRSLGEIAQMENRSLVWKKYSWNSCLGILV